MVDHSLFYGLIMVVVKNLNNILIRIQTHQLQMRHFRKVLFPVRQYFAKDLEISYFFKGKNDTLL